MAGRAPASDGREGAGAAPRRLIATADDFGASSAVNRAVAAAHTHGILTTASLMVRGEAAAEAVDLARDHPRLAVGLHLTLLQGRAVLPPGRIPHLVGPDGRLPEGPVVAGLRYFFRPGLGRELLAEARAQIEAYLATGLPLGHLDGHLHVHVHPALFDGLLDLLREYGIPAVRIPLEPLWPTLGIGGRRLGYKLAHALIFGVLGRRARARLKGRGIACADRVFGLLQHGHVDEAYLTRLVPRLPPGVNELYAHPRDGPGAGKVELQALLSAQVRAAIDAHGVELMTYGTLRGNPC